MNYKYFIGGNDDEGYTKIIFIIVFIVLLILFIGYFFFYSKITTTAPTQPPTQPPSAAPTPAPTQRQTAAPTPAPTAAPTQPPTAAPTPAPTQPPTAAPTPAPTQPPTPAPTAAPQYGCLSGYQLIGDFCIPNPPSGYITKPGDINYYWLSEQLSYQINPQKPNQDNSACNGLTDVKYGYGTCTAYKTTCTTVGCGCIKQAAQPDCNPIDDEIYDNNTNTCTGRQLKCSNNRFGVRSCNYVSATRTAAKICPSGLRSDGTMCWQDAHTTCDVTSETRTATITCPTGYDLINGLCFQKCNDGYHKKQSDLIYCWNDKDEKILITGITGKIRIN